MFSHLANVNVDNSVELENLLREFGNDKENKSREEEYAAEEDKKVEKEKPKCYWYDFLLAIPEG